MFIVTSKQMYLAEANAVDRGMTFSELMENAGQACAEKIAERYNITKTSPKTVLVICGKGKNGGDGFVIARSLWEKGGNITILLADGEPRDIDSADNLVMAESAGIQTVHYNNEINEIIPYITHSDIVVDALFGTGFRGALQDNLSVLVKAVTLSEKPVISIDVPSGTNCDAASVEGTAFRADLTLAVSAYKPIHIMKPSCEYCGEIIAVDIGITEEDYKKIDQVLCFTCDDEEIKSKLPRRKVVSNKGTYGNALEICGSMNMPGACYFAAMGALRSGAGLVTLAFPKSAYIPIATKLSEPVFLPLESNLEGSFSFSALSDITEALKRATAVLIGCGIGYNKDTCRLVPAVLKELRVPAVLDADGLNAISSEPDVLKDVLSPLIVTPHPGEMSRLCKKSVQEIISDPIGTAFRFSKEFGVVTILKGANTVVCSPSDNLVYINRTGNAGLARGGCGDLLAGMTVSLLAQGMSPFESAVCAVYLHGKCADDVAEKSSMRGMLPTDVINNMAEFFGKYE